MVFAGRRSLVPSLSVVLSAALVCCSGGSSSSTSPDASTKGGSDATAESQAPLGSALEAGADVETQDVVEESPPEAQSDAPVDAADAASAADAADAALCLPSCAHRPCGVPGGDGCGGTCMPQGDAGDEGCLETAYYTVTYGDPLFGGLCASAGARNSTSCSAGAKRYCEAKGFGTGFPEQTIATAVGILCVSLPATDLGNVPASTLAGFQSGCSSSNNNFYSIDCEAAADDYCTGLNKGYVAGFGPNEVDGQMVSVSCLPSSVAVSLNAPLSTFQGSCGVARNQNCDADAANYCTANGYAGGFGPLQASTPNMQATVVCILND